MDECARGLFVRVVFGSRALPARGPLLSRSFKKSTEPKHVIQQSMPSKYLVDAKHKENDASRIRAYGECHFLKGDKVYEDFGAYYFNV